MYSSLVSFGIFWSFCLAKCYIYQAPKKGIYKKKKLVSHWTFQELVDPSPFPSIKWMQLLESHETNVVFHAVYDWPLCVPDWLVQLCFMWSEIKYVISRTFSRQLVQVFYLSHIVVQSRWNCYVTFHTSIHFLKVSKHKLEKEEL